MNRTRALTEGAILISLFMILLLASLYIPFVMMVMMFTLAIPFIIYTYRHGFKQAMMFFSVSLVVTYMIVGVMTVPLTFMFGSSGIAMGYIYKRHEHAFAVLVSGSLAFIANLVVFYIGSIVILQINFVEEVKKTFRQSLDMAENMFTSMGQDSSGNFEKVYEQIEVISYIIPSGLIIFGITISLITQILANRVLKRLKSEVHTFPSFKEWKFPKSLLWYYLIFMVLSFFNFEEGSAMFLIVINAVYILEIVMIIQGLSLIYYYSHIKSWSKSVPILITIVAVFIPLLLQLVKILGIIDLGFDIRKKIHVNDKKE